MDPATFGILAGSLVLAGIASAIGCLLLGRAVEARAGAAELALERARLAQAEALAAERLELLGEAQHLLADAARGDQGLADLAQALSSVAGADPRERALGLLRQRAAAGAGRASGPGAPGPAPTPGQSGAVAGVGGGGSA